ncbi:MULTISPECIES: DNA primase [Kyrpidia]|uniref:DNA primase n=2 Tax=Kyrpidia spormannii TaxID=2055160 RepID=A0A6F9E4B0_9BACL|nr:MULTISPECIES: DNA primase [Kyrpidia]MCL6577139.1 DNA primase [Kyrpidia sp.]CAB3391234.1 DNA primase [Kyrpidia spormannii]CAB3392145.1 DNA primase [Kyrpidia spormannii]HHY66431.1 DNA primase [Alicyclobacillus sp.]
MARRIPEDLIDRVRQSVDIIDVIGEYVHLRRVGRSYVGLCPFHSERTPSFTVSREKQVYHCFGCQAGGTVIHFLMAIDGITFQEAVRKLAARSGIPVPDVQEDEEESGYSEKRRDALRAYELAAKWYQHLLLNTVYGRPGRTYLEKRRISTTTAHDFQLGLAPASRDSLMAFLERRGLDPVLLMEIGLGATGEHGRYDRFRNRLMFPIWDGQGRVVAFGGRVLGRGEPKYLNSPETPLFHKGRHLYPWHKARSALRKTRRAFLLEGYMDVVAMHQAGFTAAVASLGTALTEEQARMLKHNVDEVIVVYDGDDAGRRAAVRAGLLLQGVGVTAKAVRLPPGMDPDDLLREKGPEAMKRVLEQETMSLTAFRLADLRDRRSLANAEDRVSFLQEALNVLADEESAVEAETHLQSLSSEFHISLEALRHDLDETRQRQTLTRDKHGNKWNTNIDPATGPQVNHYPPHVAAERQMLTSMLLDPGAARQVEEVVADEFCVESHAVLAAHLYRYYGDGGTADPTAFLETVDDPAVRSVVTSLIMEHERRRDQGRAGWSLEDCFATWRLARYEDALRQVRESFDEAARAGRFEEMYRLQEQMKSLREEIDALKNHQGVFSQSRTEGGIR